MLERFVKGIVEKEGKTSVIEIPVDNISVNPYQPRRHFDEDRLNDLSRSIKEQGVLQPVIVRRFGTGYELVAGERRLRASKMAGLSTIPAIVRTLNDQDMIEIAFIENLQREQLNEIETAEAYGRIIGEKGHDLDRIADRVGKDVDSIKAKLWMLQLPQVIKKAVVSRLITLEHARLLSQVANQKKQVELLERIYREKLDEARTEELVSELDSFLKVRPETLEKMEDNQPRFKYDPDRVGRVQACLGLVRDLVINLRHAGIDVNISELITGESVNVKLTFPLSCRTDAAAGDN